MKGVKGLRSLGFNRCVTPLGRGFKRGAAPLGFAPLE
jgi:hypothetical protein